MRSVRVGEKSKSLDGSISLGTTWSLVESSVVGEHHGPGLVSGSLDPVRRSPRPQMHPDVVSTRDPILSPVPDPRSPVSGPILDTYSCKLRSESNNFLRV